MLLLGFENRFYHFMLLRFVLLRYLNYFFTDETEDEDANKEYIEETNRDVVIVAAAKLVADDTVPKVNLQYLALKYNKLPTLNEEERNSFKCVFISSIRKTVGEVV